MHLQDTFCGQSQGHQCRSLDVLWYRLQLLSCTFVLMVVTKARGVLVQPDSERPIRGGGAQAVIDGITTPPFDPIRAARRG